MCACKIEREGERERQTESEREKIKKAREIGLALSTTHRIILPTDMLLAPHQEKHCQEN